MGLALAGSGEDPSPSLADIPGMLRSYANRLEGTELPMPCTLLYVADFPDGALSVGAFGDNPSRLELIGLLTQAIHDLTS